MKSITIHGLDDLQYELIRKKAQSQGLSLNKTIKKLLDDSLGIKSPDTYNRKKDFQEFMGLWSKSDVNKFNTSVKDFETINDEDWS